MWLFRLPMKRTRLLASHRKLRVPTGDKGAAKAGGKEEVGEAARRLPKLEHVPRNKPGSPFSGLDGGCHRSAEGNER